MPNSWVDRNQREDDEEGEKQFIAPEKVEHVIREA